MDEPVDTAAVAAHLKTTHGLGSIDAPSAYHSNWLDNARAKLDLNRRPRTHLAKLIDAARTFQHAPDDPRKVWYRGDPPSRQKLIQSAMMTRTRVTTSLSPKFECAETALLISLV